MKSDATGFAHLDEAEELHRDTGANEKRDDLLLRGLVLEPVALRAEKGLDPTHPSRPR
jgi:hypothetical protein